MSTKPTVRTIRDEPHRLVVLYVTGSDAQGRPTEARIVYDDATVQIVNGAEFVTCWIPEKTLHKRD